MSSTRPGTGNKPSPKGTKQQQHHGHSHGHGHGGEHEEPQLTAEEVAKIQRAEVFAMCRSRIHDQETTHSAVISVVDEIVEASANEYTKDYYDALSIDYCVLELWDQMGSTIESALLTKDCGATHQTEPEIQSGLDKREAELAVQLRKSGVALHEGALDVDGLVGSRESSARSSRVTTPITFTIDFGVGPAAQHQQQHHNATALAAQIVVPGSINKLPQHQHPHQTPLSPTAAAASSSSSSDPTATATTTGIVPGISLEAPPQQPSSSTLHSQSSTTQEDDLVVASSSVVFPNCAGAARWGGIEHGVLGAWAADPCPGSIVPDAQGRHLIDLHRRSAASAAASGAKSGKKDHHARGRGTTRTGRPTWQGAPVIVTHGEQQQQHPAGAFSRKNTLSSTNAFLSTRSGPNSPDSSRPHSATSSAAGALESASVSPSSIGGGQGRRRGTNASPRQQQQQAPGSAGSNKSGSGKGTSSDDKQQQQQQAEKEQPPLLTADELAVQSDILRLKQQRKQLHHVEQQISAALSDPKANARGVVVDSVSGKVVPMMPTELALAAKKTDSPRFYVTGTSRSGDGGADEQQPQQQQEQPTTTAAGGVRAMTAPAGSTRGAAGPTAEGGKASHRAGRATKEDFFVPDGAGQVRMVIDLNPTGGVGVREAGGGGGSGAGGGPMLGSQRRTELKLPKSKMSREDYQKIISQANAPLIDQEQQEQQRLGIPAPPSGGAGGAKKQPPDATKQQQDQQDQQVSKDASQQRRPNAPDAALGAVGRRPIYTPRQQRVGGGKQQPASAAPQQRRPSQQTTPQGTNLIAQFDQLQLQAPADLPNFPRPPNGTPRTLHRAGHVHTKDTPRQNETVYQMSRDMGEQKESQTPRRTRVLVTNDAVLYQEDDDGYY